MLNYLYKFVSFLLLTLFLFLAPPIYANHTPAPNGYVNDFAGILTEQQESSLENTLKDFEQKTTNEIAIVIIKSLNGDSIENFAVKTFEEWRIGKKGKDNGTLFLAAIDDREMRIEVGYGLEPYLTDGEAGEIVRNRIAPEFQKGNYYQGIYLGMEKVMQEIAGESTTTSYQSDWFSKILELDSDLLMLLLLPFIVIIAIILLKITTPLLNRIDPHNLQVFDEKLNRYRLPKRPGEKRLVFWTMIILLISGLAIYVASPATYEFLGSWQVLLAGFLLTYLCAFLARSKSFWAGGVIGAILGVGVGFWVNANFDHIITWSILFGGGGLILDFILSRNYRRLNRSDQSTGFWPSWGGFKGFGGYGGGSSGGGGTSGRW